MQDCYIVDGHCDSLLDFVSGKRSLDDPSQGGQWDIQRARLAGVALQFMAAFIETQYKPARSTWRGLQLIEGAHRFIEGHPKEVFLIRGKNDLRHIPDPNRIALLLSVEGGEILGEDLFMLNIIFKLGVRALGLTWNQRNALADGVGEGNTPPNGLTKFGEKVVFQMNQLGMLIDVSHLNEAGFWDVLELSKTPITASHSCAKALCSHLRNLTDKQLSALAEHKGVVGVNFYPNFLKENGEASRNDVIRHIYHIAEIAGVETIGLGSDFDGINKAPKGMENVEKYCGLIEDLAKEGFSDSDIKKIMGRNFVRLLSNVLK